jgi:hypothetical protein
MQTSHMHTRTLTVALAGLALALGCARTPSALRDEHAREQQRLSQKQLEERQELAEKQAKEQLRAEGRHMEDQLERRAEMREDQADLVKKAQAACELVSADRLDVCPVHARNVSSITNIDDGIALNLKTEAGSATEVERQVKCYQARRAAGQVSKTFYESGADASAAAAGETKDMHAKHHKEYKDKDLGASASVGGAGVSGSLGTQGTSGSVSTPSGSTASGSIGSDTYGKASDTYSKSGTAGMDRAGTPPTDRSTTTGTTTASPFDRGTLVASASCLVDFPNADVDVEREGGQVVVEIKTDKARVIELRDRAQQSLGNGASGTLR